MKLNQQLKADKYYQVLMHKDRMHDKDHNNTIKLSKESIKEGYSDGINMVGEGSWS